MLLLVLVTICCSNQSLCESVRLFSLFAIVGLLDGVYREYVATEGSSGRASQGLMIYPRRIHYNSVTPISISAKILRFALPHFRRCCCCCGWCAPQLLTQFPLLPIPFSPISPYRGSLVPPEPIRLSFFNFFCLCSLSLCGVFHLFVRRKCM